MRVLVLHGADAVEPPPADPVLDQVSAALDELGHAVERRAVDADLPAFVRALSRSRPDLVFNLAESFAGRSSADAGIAGLMNLLDLRYTGSSHSGLILAGDKSLAKMILSHHRIDTPQFAVIRRGTIESAGQLADFPLIVKPSQEDASIGITTDSVVHDPDELLARIDQIHREHGCNVLVEQYVDGREFYVGVLGNERAEALPIAELDMSDFPPDVPRVASFAAKWQQEHPDFARSRAVFPDDLDDVLTERIHKIALGAFHALRLRDYARIDLRVSHDGHVYIIEANPNPYLARDEVFATAAARAGIAYTDLIGRIVELASARYAR